MNMPSKGEYTISKKGQEIIAQLPQDLQREIHVGDDVHSKRCFWCKRILIGMPTKDHIIPRYHGGKLTDGWVTAHQKCNSLRGSNDFLKMINKVYNK